MRLSDLQRGQRVTILNAYKQPERSGTIIGEAAVTAFHDHKAAVLVVVGLDEGFWSDGRTTFVSALLVHPDNLRPESDAPPCKDCG